MPKGTGPEPLDFNALCRPLTGVLVCVCVHAPAHARFPVWLYLYSCVCAYMCCVCACVPLACVEDKIEMQG